MPASLPIMTSGPSQSVAMAPALAMNKAGVMKKETSRRRQPAARKRVGGRGLPAGLRHAGDETVRGEFAESDTRKLEAADVATLAPAGQAAAAHAHRASIARELRQADVVALRLQFGA